MNKHSVVLVLLFFIAAVSADLNNEIIAEMNKARANPAAYASNIPANEKETISFLKSQKAMGPLTRNAGLDKVAQALIEIHQKNKATGHDKFNERFKQFGVVSGTWAENANYGRRDAKSIVTSFIIDAGVPSKGHRKNIFNEKLKVVGSACGNHPVYGIECVQDFATGYTPNAPRSDEEELVEAILAHQREKKIRKTVQMLADSLFD